MTIDTRVEVHDDSKKSYIGNLNHMVEHTERVAANVSTSVHILDAAGTSIPFTVNDHEPDILGRNCYVVSLYSMYVNYAEEELRLVSVPAPVKSILFTVIRLLALMLNIAKIDDYVMINNWILSTNLYPTSSEFCESLECITDQLSSRYPGKFLVFRSLNVEMNSSIINRLLQIGFKKLLSRQIYIYHSKQTKRTRSLRNDMQHLKHTKYVYVAHNEFNAHDLVRCLDLYNMLYLVKYSDLNPKYSLEFFKGCYKSGMYEFHGWRSPDSLEIEGFCSTFTLHGTASNPLFGYNISLRNEEGLYRLCSLMPILRAREDNVPIHMSAGAASFKIRRGALPFMEYSMIFDQHLAWHRRAVVSLLSGLLNIIDWAVSTFGIIL